MRANISRELAVFRLQAGELRPRSLSLHKTSQHDISRTNKMKTTTIKKSYPPLLLLSLILALSTSTGVARAFAPAVARKSAKSGSDVDTAELLKQPLSGLLDQYAGEREQSSRSFRLFLQVPYDPKR